MKVKQRIKAEIRAALLKYQETLSLSENEIIRKIEQLKNI